MLHNSDGTTLCILHTVPYSVSHHKVIDIYSNIHNLTGFSAHTSLDGKQVILLLDMHVV